MYISCSLPAPPDGWNNLYLQVSNIYVLNSCGVFTVEDEFVGPTSPVDDVPNEPESITVTPPKRVAGLSVFSKIVFAPTCIMEDVTYVKDEVPITVKFCDMVTEPVMDTSWFNELTYEAVNVFDADIALVVLPLINDAVIVLTINEPVISNEPESVGIVLCFKYIKLF